MSRGGTPRAAERSVAYRAVDWEAWTPDQRATLLFVLRDDAEILLIHKKRGIGAGKINGPGGRIQPGESPLECALREVREEVCIEATGVRPAGQLAFQFTDGLALHVAVFTATGHRGDPRETDEAVPLWTPIDGIPYERMWADDRIWLPWVLEGRRIEGRALFEDDTMLGYEFWAEGTSSS